MWQWKLVQIICNAAAYLQPQRTADGCILVATALAGGWEHVMVLSAAGWQLGTWMTQTVGLRPVPG